jgi:glutamyl-tRNA(Gln) amidotransferase subunit D
MTTDKSKRKDAYKGYNNIALKVLKEMDVTVWSDCIVKTDDNFEYEGIILPRAEGSGDEHIVLKLKNGYNVGVNVNNIKSIKEINYKEAVYKIPEKEFPYNPDMPRVTLLGTGGTIASRLDYRTGAVIPAFTPGELYGSVPELADICNLNTIKLFGVFSENMGKDEYIGLAEAIEEQIKDGVDGIVIGHGTDTMHHTAAIISFMVQDSPIPIVFVGSQRSSDRPSSDAAFNLKTAVRTAAYSDVAEPVISMYGPTSDEYCLLHRGTRVRKMHSSYRSTFRTLSDIPIAMVTPDSFKPLREDYNKRRHDKDVKVNTAFEERVGILYYYPNMHPDRIDSLIDLGYKGIVIAGTGLGHVNKPLYKSLEKAQKENVAVYMTVQTLWGYVHMYVYETGRDMLARGVIPSENMLPEVAYMKLCWALGQSEDLEEVRDIMLTPINNEITEREPYNGYIILQGGIPEIDEFLTKHWL